jgi:hypothetical protein
LLAFAIGLRVQVGSTLTKVAKIIDKNIRATSVKSKNSKQVLNLPTLEPSVSRPH